MLNSQIVLEISPVKDNVEKHLPVRNLLQQFANCFLEMLGDSAHSELSAESNPNKETKPKSVCYRYCVCIGLGSILSDDSETRDEEVDLMHSTLVTSEPNSSTKETARSLQPCSTRQPTCQHIVAAQVSSGSQLIGNDSIMISDQVEESSSVFQPSDIGHGIQNSKVVLSTSSSSTQLDLDRSIVTTTVLSSTPLHTDDSKVTRTIPSPSASSMNMERQFADRHTSLRHS